MINTHFRRDPVKPTPGVGEALWVVAADALVVVALALVFSYIAARENRPTTWPMPSECACAPAGWGSCVVATGVSIKVKGCHERSNRD